jgi:hypothetical protein
VWAAPRTHVASSFDAGREAVARHASESNPQSTASAALRRRFDTIHSNARAKPSRRWMNHVLPASGTSPMPMKPGTKVALSEPMRTSQEQASESPAPAAGPLTAARTGFSRARIARMFG